MKLDFKPTKVPEFEIQDAAGINYLNRIGTKNSDTHYKITKNRVTFRVKKEDIFVKFLDNGKKELNEKYYLYIEYLKETILKEEVESFEIGFEKANIWADKHLSDFEYLNSLIWDIKEKRQSKILEEENVDTLEKAKTVKFPCFSKYSGEYIYDVMQTDLEHCVAYYAGNLNSKEFNFSSVGVNQLNYNPSSERTKSYNCIKYLLDTFYPHISKNLLAYFKDISLDDAKKIIFTSGKYKGKTAYDVYKENRSYLEWYLQNTKKTIYNIRMITAINLIKECE
ncbi:hypothetical protein [Clostridioides difficile]|uniref:exodeoxyribonuclease X C-terminal domain-containing protein n=1 Tax=Clostridioides difficile TaxID=1496 RepID=UPI000938C4F1|nr:hypothetical protein [Clostridioides difficile]EGT4117179.1 hypothetical protein [Clostridioides difficile]EGT4846833.1 hypothetical protein [Clostridioides difficile]EGT5015114.1 hypothetical protein [Clostridioides difficile]EGT5086719.1 hypothetical protein [Clostridioides difficile]EIS9354925.1 hypothetical protein [Clostridioides difficile]